MKMRKCCHTPRGAGPHEAICQHSHETCKPDETKPDYTKDCIVCGNSPVLPVTGMCPVCTFGEASAMEDFM